jgi:hypothetical protein
MAPCRCTARQHGESVVGADFVTLSNNIFWCGHKQQKSERRRKRTTKLENFVKFGANFLVNEGHLNARIEHACGTIRQQAACPMPAFKRTSCSRDSYCSDGHGGDKLLLFGSRVVAERRDAPV